MREDCPKGVLLGRSGTNKFYLRIFSSTSHFFFYCGYMTKLLTRLFLPFNFFLANIFYGFNETKTCCHPPTPRCFCSVHCSSRFFIHLELGSTVQAWSHICILTIYRPSLFTEFILLENIQAQFRIQTQTSFEFQVGFDCSSLSITDTVAVHPDMGATCALPLEDPFSRGREEDQPNLFLCLNVPLSLLGLSHSSY